jgi:hypothetical protein
VEYLGCPELILDQILIFLNIAHKSFYLVKGMPELSILRPLRLSGPGFLRRMASVGWGDRELR